MVIEERYEFAVIGGGISGICVAMAAARYGVKTALIQDRPVLGGNASGEIRMHICGADRHGTVADARETGIIEELLLKNRYVNPQHSFSVQDTVLWECVKAQQNLDLYLNTRIVSVDTADDRILSVRGVQTTTEKNFTFFADLFADATGNGFVGAQAGAEFMIGSEGKDTFGEPDAPDEYENKVMGDTLLFSAKDMGHPVPFKKFDWAYTFTEEDLKWRDHSEITSGYWWIELSGSRNIISDAEDIRDELLKTLYGVWDHIKNGPDHKADNYALDWVGMLPGKRESRRLTGDHILTENDLLRGEDFEDTVAYGGWTMDIHTNDGILDKGPANRHYDAGIYGIPYRCLYSKNIKNLFLAGRIISVSHLVFGSTRVMGTCAVVGQAVGTAAGLMKKLHLHSPREMNAHIEELRQTLLKDDCYIPNAVSSDEKDLARKAEVKATSQIKDALPMNVINGVGRNVAGKCNAWIGAEAPQTLTLRWDEAITASCVMIRFDSNLSKELTITLSDNIRKNQRSFPDEIVKDFDVVFFKAGKQVAKRCERENILRNVRIDFDPVEFDRMELRLLATHGAKQTAVFEVRVYA